MEAKKTCISACMRDSNEILKAIPMFSMSSNTTEQNPVKELSNADNTCSTSDIFNYKSFGGISNRYNILCGQNM